MVTENAELKAAISIDVLQLDRDTRRSLYLVGSVGVQGTVHRGELVVLVLTHPLPPQ
jgi:hypothetical protein